MVKKRPSAAPRRSLKQALLFSKMEPKYWRQRLFRNTFTHKGNRFQVNHWSVKIQRRGTRKTFSLRAGNRDRAANEACQLYKAIVTRGWQTVSARADNKASGPGAFPELLPAVGQNGFDAEYWAPRLIHRKYTEELHENADRELSVRIEHAGTSHYFPLGTHIRRLAAKRAVQIYQVIASQGWDQANTRFPRELSVAFRWLDSPVAWTYTTIHTRPTMPLVRSAVISSQAGARLEVAIAESDAGIRQALAWSINQEDRISCVATFDSAATALREVPRQPIQLVLANQNLTDMQGSVFIEKLKAIAPKVAVVVFSVFEDCDQLFKCAPGGAGSYLFRRTAATRILEPIAKAGEKALLSREAIADGIRHYFESVVESLPVSGSAHQLSSLTQREHEILALLSKGQPDKEIADLLRISTWTVHGHLKKIFEKLAVHNRIEAVLKYLHK